MRIGVKILPRKEVLDSQGRAVAQTLETHGFNVEALTVGKYVELEFSNLNKNQATAKAQEIAEFILCNPLIETFELEVFD